MRIAVASLVVVVMIALGMLWWRSGGEPAPVPGASAPSAPAPEPIAEPVVASAPAEARAPAASAHAVHIEVHSDRSAAGGGWLGLSTPDFRFRRAVAFTHNATVEIDWPEPGAVVAWTDRGANRALDLDQAGRRVDISLAGVATFVAKDAAGAVRPGATIWCATPSTWRVVTEVARTDASGRATLYGVQQGCVLRASTDDMVSEWRPIEAGSDGEQTLAIERPAVRVAVERDGGGAVSGALLLVRSARGEDFCGTDARGFGLLDREDVTAQGAEIVVDKDGCAPGRIVMDGGVPRGPAVLQPGAHVRCVLTAHGAALSAGPLIAPGLIERSGHVIDGVGLVRDIAAGGGELALRHGGAVLHQKIDLRAGWNDLAWDIGGETIQGVVRTDAGAPLRWRIEARRASGTGNERQAAGAFTDEQGAYQIRGLERDAMFELRLVHLETAIVVARQQARAGTTADFTVTAQDVPSCAVYGRVWKASGALPRVGVKAVGRDREGRSSVLDAEGRFEIDKLFPGECELLVAPSDWSSPLKRQLTLLPGERQQQDIELPEPGCVEASISGIPAGQQEAVVCTVEVGGVCLRMQRNADGWRSGNLAPGEYRVKAFGMAPLATTVRVEPGRVAHAQIEWQPGVDVLLTAVGISQSDMYKIRGEAADSFFVFAGSGDPKALRIDVAPGRIYQVQAWTKEDGDRSGTLVVPSAGFPVGEPWRTTVEFH